MNDPLGVIKKLLWKDLEIFWPLLVDIFIGISVLNGMKNTLNIVDITPTASSPQRSLGWSLIL